MITEGEAKRILAEQFGVSSETLCRLAAFVALLQNEGERQNLISRATMEHVWSRHILDSAQLVRFAPAGARTWLDLGSGAGFPGLIAAALHPAHVTLVESRKLRIEFLLSAAEVLQLPRATRILCTRAERLGTGLYDVISARAFAPLDPLFELAHRFAAPVTRWVLPKGKNARVELDAARTSWQGVFHVEPSLTDPDAGIIIAEQVRRVSKGKHSR